MKTKLLLGFAIIGILLFGTLVFADTSDLELEMNNLISELNNGGLNIHYY